MADCRRCRDFALSLLSGVGSAVPTAANTTSPNNELYLAFDEPVTSLPTIMAAWSWTLPTADSGPTSAFADGGAVRFTMNETSSPPHSPGTVTYDGSDAGFQTASGPVPAFTAFAVPTP